MRSFLINSLLNRPQLRRWATKLLEGDRDIDLSMLGSSYRINTIKEHGYLRASRLIRDSALLRDELPVLINLASLFEPGDTFVDVGANIGIYSLTLARLARLHPGVTFHAFEANPDTFLRLQTFAGEKGVEVHNLALSDHEGELGFVGGAVSHVFTTLDNANSYSIPKEITRVPCRRLDQLTLPGNSLIIKIDVEGQEKKVLEGAEGFLRDRRVKAVYLDENKDADTQSHLASHGFALFHGRTLEPATGHIPFSLLALRSSGT
jgi:FkbM family methyltransferase